MKAEVGGIQRATDLFYGGTGIHWLSDFSYRTTIAWWIFPLAGVLTLLIALLTISIQTVEAAFANPVDSLRAE
jgi:hypothetical protein